MLPVPSPTPHTPQAGIHNAYHVQPQPALLALLTRYNQANFSRHIEYSHRPLGQLLETARMVSRWYQG